MLTALGSEGDQIKGLDLQAANSRLEADIGRERMLEQA